MIVQPLPQGCGERCEAATSIEELNRTCYCLSLDEEALRRELEADLDTRGLSRAMAATHPHLFASVPMFVSRDKVEGMARVVAAVEAVVATPHFRRAGLAWAPDIARYDATGAFRPLKSAPALIRGWEIVLPDVPSLLLALDTLDSVLPGTANAAERARLRLQLGIAEVGAPAETGSEPNTLDRLTPTERSIAGLIAAGLANPAIANRLGLSKRTVEHHISNIYAKLAFTTRVAVAKLKPSLTV